MAVCALIALAWSRFRGTASDQVDVCRKAGLSQPAEYVVSCFRHVVADGQDVDLEPGRGKLDSCLVKGQDDPIESHAEARRLEGLAAKDISQGIGAPAIDLARRSQGLVVEFEDGARVLV